MCIRRGVNFCYFSMVKIYNVSCVCPLHNETQMSIAVLSKVLSIKMVYICHVHVIALFWID